MPSAALLSPRYWPRLVGWITQAASYIPGKAPAHHHQPPTGEYSQVPGAQSLLRMAICASRKGYRIEGQLPHSLDLAQLFNVEV